jgi:hypothetical protein
MVILESILSALSFLAEIMGSILLVVIFLSIILIAIVLVLLVYSFKTGKVPFPNLVIITIIFFEGPIKAIMRLGGVDDTAIDQLSVDLQNRVMRPTFVRIPYDKRAIFIPQCLRSVNCQARLSPEGIKCMGCGACEISKAKKEAEGMGYLFFVVPGSSFMVRMIKKYRPQAIIGVGCMGEVKEGLDLMHKNNMPAIGVVLTTAGCVGTILDWEKLYEVMKAYDNKST